MTIPLPPSTATYWHADHETLYTKADVRAAQRLALEASIKALVNRPRESPTIVLAHMLKEIES